ncbi:MAG: DUF6794 domain-containing protein [Deltaproteobacteria bacterium]
MKNPNNPYILLLFFTLLTINSYAQQNDPQTYLKDTSEIRKLAEKNRSKATINGTYIPVDIEDAVKRLRDLSPGASLEKFKNAPEAGIDRKLHFGIGKWMIVNWYFYEGSRLEFYLRQLGLSHPDDMADFLIICFHRDLNGKNKDVKTLAAYYSEKRYKELLDKGKIIDKTDLKGLKKK